MTKGRRGSLLGDVVAVEATVEVDPGGGDVGGVAGLGKGVAGADHGQDATAGADQPALGIQGGAGVELPKPDMRRDGSGTELSAPIAIIG